MYISLQMHEALRQGQTGINEFLMLWAESLTPEQQKELSMLQQKGGRLGLHFVATDRAEAQIMLTDQDGSIQILQRVEFLDGVEKPGS